MKRPLLLTALCLLCLSLTGCIDLKQDYTLNPDGSGKVRLEVVTPVGNPFFDEAKDKDLKTRVRKAVAEEIKKAEGVDAWKDVNYGLLPDGRLSMRATVYFRDINKLSLHLQGYKGSFTRPAMNTSPGGDITVTLLEKKTDHAKTRKGPDPNTLTGQALKDYLMTARVDYQNMRGFLRAAFEDMKISTTLHVPGPVKSRRILKPAGTGAVLLQVEGKKVFDMVDDLVKDETLLAQLVKQGFDMGEGPQGEELFMRKLFGEPGPPSVVLATKGKPQFDYEKEVAPARQAASALAAQVGLTDTAGAAKPAAAATGGLAGLEVVGVRRVFKANEEKGLMPMGQGLGLTLAVLVDFGGEVLKAEKLTLKSATADTGESLLPEDEWRREISYLSLNQDKAGTVVEIPLLPPGEKVQGIGEITGEVAYVTGSATKTVGLGFSKLAAGEKGKQHDASIESVSTRDDGKTDVEVKLALAETAVKDVVFLDAKGKPLAANRTGKSGWGESVTLYYALQGPLPADGQLEAALYTDLKSFTAPFKLQNLDLMGRAR